MVNNYDNWERLVRSVLDREKRNQLALCSSLSSSCNSSTSSSSFDNGSGSRIVEIVHWLNEELQSCNISSSTEEINQIFFLIKRLEGKKITIGARKLMISWGEDPNYWNWTNHPDSRFSEVAELLSVSWLDINCKIETRLLSRKTRYGAYLVFKLEENNYGLGSVNGVVRFVEYEVKVGAEKRASVLHLDQVAVRREDGWVEIELGDFFNDEGEDGEVEARMMEIHSGQWKSGIIVEAIEFRPKKSYDHVQQRLKLIIGTESIQEHRSGSAAYENQRSSGAYDHEWGSPVFRKIPYRADPRFSQMADFLKVMITIQNARRFVEADTDVARTGQFIHLNRERLTANRSLVPQRQTGRHRLWGVCWKPAGVSIQFRRPGTSHHDPTQQTGQQQSNFIVGARQLKISWGDNPTYWNWMSHPDSRFSEVAHLKSVCWLDIKCNIETRMLSQKTTYGAYLVFKLAEQNNGLGSVNGVVRFVEYESETDAEKRATPLHLDQLAATREDGWTEIELGVFSNDKGEDGEVEARLMEIRSGHWKSGIIVEAIEFRRKTSVGHLSRIMARRT